MSVAASNLMPDLAAQLDPLAGGGFGQGRLAGVGIERGRHEAHQAQDHRPVGGVAAAGQGQGGVEPRLDPGDVGSLPASRSRPTNRPAAVIGPMVWLLDGPTPSLNRSKTEAVIAELHKRVLSAVNGFGDTHSPGKRRGSDLQRME
jgi:hypothetical protein